LRHDQGGFFSFDQVNPSGFTFLTLNYREEGKMQAEAHERGILDGLSAGAT